MKINDKYWTAYYNKSTGFGQFVESAFHNDTVDARRKRENRIFETSAEAKEWLETQYGKN